jgi:hypothetical protein
MRLLQSVGIVLSATLVAVQTAAAIPPQASGIRAITWQQVAPAAPAPSDVLKAKRVFVQNAGGDPEMYSRFLTALNTWGHYTLVSSPAQADIVFAFHEEPLSVAMVDPSTEIVLTTVTALQIARRGDEAKQAALAIESLIGSIKVVVGTSLSAEERAAMTPPAVGKHQGLIVGIVIGGSLAIACSVVLLLHGRGH